MRPSVRMRLSVLKARFLTSKISGTKVLKCYLEFCKVGTPERPMGLEYSRKGNEGALT